MHPRALRTEMRSRQRLNQTLCIEEYSNPIIPLIDVLKTSNNELDDGTHGLNSQTSLITNEKRP